MLIGMQLFEYCKFLFWNLLILPEDILDLLEVGVEPKTLKS